MENLKLSAFGQDSQDTNLEYNQSQFPGESDSMNVSAGDIYGQSAFGDVEYDRMSDSEYFNYLRSQDDMI